MICLFIGFTLELNRIDTTRTTPCKMHRVLLSSLLLSGLLLSNPVYANGQQAILEQAVKSYESGDYQQHTKNSIS